MAHELRGLEHQSPEFYVQLLVAGLAFAVVVVAFAYYLHRKHAHLLDRRRDRVRAGPRTKRKRRPRR